MNKKLIEMSLLGSASSLGLNWIYDKELMKSFSKNNDVLFLPIQHDLYKKAEHGFDVYPNHIIGDLDFMGEVLFQFHRFLYNGGNNPRDFRLQLYNHIGPNSGYEGYIEKYGKTLIADIAQTSSVSNEIDKQLIGPTLFIVGYAHGLKQSSILEYTKVLTNYQNISLFQQSIKYIFDNLTKESRTTVLKHSVSLLPKDYQESSIKAFDLLETQDFITKYSGIACGLEQSYPLVLHIVNQSTSFENALQINASLGGASSARGLLIGAFYSFLEDTPTEYKDILNVLI